MIPEPASALRRLGCDQVAHRLGISCTASGPAEDERALPALRQVLACGPTLVYTSGSYGNGHAERLVGRVLREFPEMPVQLCSRIGLVRGTAPHPYAGPHLRHQIEQSLENLYAECLDICVLESLDFGEDDRYLDAVVGQMRAFRDLGAISAIGMRGPCSPDCASPAERAAVAQRFLNLFLATGPDVVWTPLEAARQPLDGEGADLLSLAARHGVRLVVATEPTPQALRTAATYLRRTDGCAVVLPVVTPEQVVRTYVSARRELCWAAIGCPSTPAVDEPGEGSALARQAPPGHPGGLRGPES